MDPDNDLYIDLHLHGREAAYRIGPPRCTLCGSLIFSDRVSVLLKSNHGDEYLERLGAGRYLGNLGNVCMDCLRAGPAGARERAQNYAAELREQADTLEGSVVNMETMPLDNWATPEDVEEIRRRFDEEDDAAA